MIVEVNSENIQSAAFIHSQSWQASHSGFCEERFVALHTPERQEAYLQNEIDCGKRLYMLIKEAPAGIVSIQEDLIENLYVLPSEQHKGYGTELLLFAIGRCAGTPRLWLLDNNTNACRLYQKHGFVLTGRKHPLSDTLSEVEMKQSAAENGHCPRHDGAAACRADI